MPFTSNDTKSFVEKFIKFALEGQPYSEVESTFDEFATRGPLSDVYTHEETLACLMWLGSRG